MPTDSSAGESAAEASDVSLRRRPQPVSIPKNKKGHRASKKGHAGGPSPSPSPSVYGSAPSSAESNNSKMKYTGSKSFPAMPGEQ